MRIVSFLFFALLPFFYWSCNEACSKKIDCPAFTDTELMEWLPYSDNEQLVFLNQQNDQEVFNLKNTYNSIPYQETGFSSPLYCISEKWFQSLETDNSGRSLFAAELQVRSTNNSQEKFASVNIFSNTIQLASPMPQGFGSVMIGQQPTIRQDHPSILIGNRSFTNIISAMRDTSLENRPGIFKIYYGKNQGIVAFMDYPSLLTWVKQ